MIHPPHMTPKRKNRRMHPRDKTGRWDNSTSRTGHLHIDHRYMPVQRGNHATRNHRPDRSHAHKVGQGRNSDCHRGHRKPPCRLGIRTHPRTRHRNRIQHRPVAPLRIVHRPQSTHRWHSGRDIVRRNTVDYPGTDLLRRSYHHSHYRRHRKSHPRHHRIRTRSANLHRCYHRSHRRADCTLRPVVRPRLCM